MTAAIRAMRRYHAPRRGPAWPGTNTLGGVVASEPFSLRDEGRCRVLQALHDHGACRRSELVRLTSLSRSTVSSLVTELAARGIVEEHPYPTGADGLRSQGRPAVMVSMAPNARYAVGVDIGHDHVRVAVCGLHGGIVAESEARREVDLAPHETLDLAASRVRQALTEHTIDTAAVIGLGLGIAAPAHTGSGRIEASGIRPGWVGINPVQEMHSRTGLNVHVINDADAGALGEHSYGAGRGVDDLLYVRLSAGIGAGVIAGRRPLSGSSGMAGELGHVHVMESGPICRCGNRGCLETVASPVAIAHLLSQSWHRPSQLTGHAESSGAVQVTCDRYSDPGLGRGRSARRVGTPSGPNRQCDADACRGTAAPQVSACRASAAHVPRSHCRAAPRLRTRRVTSRRGGSDARRAQSRYGYLFADCGRFGWFGVVSIWRGAGGVDAVEDCRGPHADKAEGGLQFVWHGGTNSGLGGAGTDLRHPRVRA